ncbi:MAG: hypothetical protein JXA03_07265 [Bacteroidales bacterium]|nr:hypothetical protein [Bacteroidales bacterium]
MKKTTRLLVMMLMATVAIYAQPPQAFKYQSVLRNSSGEILANQAVSLRMSIRTGTANGLIVYQETFSETTDAFGMVTLEIGTGTPITGTFALINWRNNSKFLQTEVDPAGGSNYVNLGTSELLSVPYALFSGQSGDAVWEKNNLNIYYNNGKVGIGTSDPDEMLEIDGNNSMAGFRASWGSNYEGLYGDFRHAGSGGLQINAQTGSGTGGWADIHFQTNGTTKMFIESGGSVGIGTTSPSASLTVKSAGYTGGMYVTSDDDERMFRVRQMSDGSGGIYVYDGADNATIQFLGQGSSFITSGNLGINTTSPDAALHVEDRIRVGEDPTYGAVYGELIHEGGGNGFKINANAGGGWADMHLQTDGNTRVFIESGGNVGIGTSAPASKLDVRGNVIVRDAGSGAIAVELGTGLDYAEGFNVTEKEKITPGTVLSIDPENPGKLKISEQANDTKVAGIVAGANDLGSGVTLGRGDHDFNVALAGRVFCNAEALTDAINVGDLLTTSDIPGYAKKISNRDEARGAILGKAMQSLEKGEKGQILVLVTLQ